MQREGGTWRLGHRPSLDGVRGVAIALVVASHAWKGWDAGGPVGVTVFFTLSGFLITSLLLEEVALNGRLSLGRFYARRAARLLPAIGAFLAFLGLLTVAMQFPVITWQRLGLVATYTTNWFMALTGEGLPRLVHLWSLAVEEQFYLVWPLVMIVCVRRLRLLAWVAALGSLGAVVERVVLYEGDAASKARIYYGTDTHADALLVGCLLAIVMHGRAEGRNRPVAAVLLLIPIFVSGLFEGTWHYLWLPTVVPLLAAAMIWCVAQAGPVHGFDQRWLVVLGQRSYGLYIWHALFITTFGGALAKELPYPVAMALMILAAWGVTLLSWKYVEQPVQSWARQRMGSGARPRSAAPAMAPTA